MDRKQTKIILVRHGECDGNVKGMFRGQMDFPLNDRGMKQAMETGEALRKAGIKHVYSSPLTRARQTAEAIAEASGLRVQICEGVTNIHLGPWEGRLKKDIAREEPALWELWLNRPEDLNFPDMEPLDNVMNRSRDALDRLVDRHGGETISVVSHRTTLKPLLASCLGVSKPWFWRFHFDTASFSVLLHDQRGYSILALNKTDHLSEFETEWN